LSRGEWFLIVLLPGFFWLGFLFFISQCWPARCPGCRRRTLIQSQMQRTNRARQAYYWCAGCGSRYKRGKHDPAAWEDASHRDDDRYYWLGLLRSREDEP
jgi:hypothetical protein